MLSRAIVVGASAGGVEALGVVLPALPVGCRVPIAVVLHQRANARSLLREIFGRRCAVPVREAEADVEATPGVWFAPPDYHLLVERHGTFALSVDPPVAHSRPSIDVLFESAAHAVTGALLAVVLSGANEDGARGAAAIRARGGQVLVQDPASAESNVMPNAALARAPGAVSASLSEIAAAMSAFAIEEP